MPHDNAPKTGSPATNSRGYSLSAGNLHKPCKLVKAPRLLDLFCGAGGCAVGYARAGFQVVGVDHKPQKHFPFAFIQAGALEYLWDHGREYDVIHASPPCQRFSVASFCRAARNQHPDLVIPCLEILENIGRPWVVENVPAAPLGLYAITLCGLSFGLKVFRHRRFASSHVLFAPPHVSHSGHTLGKRGMVCVAGHGGQSSGFGNYSRRIPADHRTKAAWSRGMGIDWMTRDELAQAIPPAYTEFIGKQIIRILEAHP